MTTSSARLEIEAFSKAAPAVRAALTEMSKAVNDSGLEKTLVELIKIRASQINGCAYCLQFHINTARKLGVAPEKLDLVAVWHEVDVFSAREAAALAWTEVLTTLSNGAPDEAYAAVGEHFSESEVVFLTVAIATINSWNRIGVALHFSPPILRHQPAAGQS